MIDARMDDPLFALNTLEAIYYLQYRTFLRNVQTTFSDFGGRESPEVRFAATPEDPPVSLYRVQGTWAVLISGVQSISQFFDVFSGANSPFPLSGWGKVNSGVLAAAKRLYDKLSAYVDPAQDDIFIAGFSLGGAIGQLLYPLYLRGGALRQKLQLMGIASPRAGFASFQSALGDSGFRWMNSQDPVPYFPPHDEESFGLKTLVDVVSGPDWNNFVQALRGNSVFPDGVTVEQAMPLGVSPDASQRLLKWSLALDPSVTDQHQMTTYANLLAKAVSVSPLPQIQRQASISVTPVGAAVAFSMPQWDQPDVVALLKGTAGGEEVAAYIPPKFRAVAKKYSGALWRVYFMGFWIIEPDSRSHAKATAKWINKMLRVLGTSKGIDQTSLIAALNAFLQTASLTTWGFNPVWSVHPNG